MKALRPPYPPNPQLVAARQLAKLSQARLGMLVGADQSVISKLENGGMEMTWGWAARLGQALNRDPKELFPAPLEFSEGATLRRAAVVARRLAGGEWTIEQELLPALYSLLLGNKISDDEETLKILDTLAQRLRAILTGT